MAGSRLALCDEKIDLHSRCGVGFRRTGIEVQFMTVGNKHLRDDILHEHPFVDFQFIEEKFFVKFFGDDGIFVEGVADEKPRVCHITLQRHAVHVEFETDVGCGRIVAGVDDHGVGQPKESVLVLTETRRLLQRGKFEFLFVLLKLRGDLVEDTLHFHLIADGVFDNIGAVKL